VGRDKELALSEGWVVEERCRVVAVLGMGGGKTSLSRTVAPSFSACFLALVANALLVTDCLAVAIRFLSDQHMVPGPSESERVAALLQLLRTQRCLLVLDNCETLFEPGQLEVRYRADIDGAHCCRQLEKRRTTAACC